MLLKKYHDYFGKIYTVNFQYNRNLWPSRVVAIHGAALSIRLNQTENNVRMYDRVAVVAATAENCKSSASNAVQILQTDESVLIPPEKLPSDTGMAKVCFAPFGNINLTDNAFLEQGIQVEIMILSWQ